MRKFKTEKIENIEYLSIRLTAAPDMSFKYGISCIELTGL
jgi:hypothetical protein